MYARQERDFTRELVNSFNTFASGVERIRLWEKILLGYSENDIFYLRHEFTKLPMDFCVSFPYLFKSRLAFCATKLCCIKNPELCYVKKTDEIVKDDKININFFKKISKHWSSGSTLVAYLEKANSHDYIGATSDYRSKAQHRHPQHFDVGQTLNIGVSMAKLSSSDLDPFYNESMQLHISATVDYGIETDIDKWVSYSPKTSEPLSTTTILPLLVEESKHLRDAFMAYRSLVDEQTNS